MAILIDTPLAHTLRAIGLGKAIPFPEERLHFHVRADFSQGRQRKSSNKTLVTSPSSSANNASDVEKSLTVRKNEVQDPDVIAFDGVAIEEYFLVGWYSDSDTANPRNWSTVKKVWCTTVICWYTFVVYCASAIFVPADIFVQLQYGVSQELSTLSLAMYVAGYGLGPMLFSPISEIARIGRNLPYLVSFMLFFIVSIIAAIVADKSFATLIVLRCLQGFFGSPILASGGASLEDIFGTAILPYAYVFWIGAMCCGPALGPLISSSAIFSNWKWPLWEIAIMSGPLLIFLLLLPETSAPKILYERAARLRKITGDKRYKSQAELVKLNTAAIFLDALIKPVEIAIKDPAIGFVCIYTSLLYATYYSFFEAFPIVYAGIYGMSLQSVSQIFTCVVVGCVIFGSVYTAWLYYVYNPRSLKQDQSLESRLQPALFAVFLLPASLFMFAWSARADVHWIVPTTGIMFYSGTCFVIFQCLICYIPLTYPKYVASLFAGNDFCRASLAAGFVMFSRLMYVNLGIAKGVSLLAGLSVSGVIGIWYLYFYGAKLRAKSKFAVS